jgi:hypothetical protein
MANINVVQCSRFGASRNARSLAPDVVLFLSRGEASARQRECEGTPGMCAYQINGESRFLSIEEAL